MHYNRVRERCHRENRRSLDGGPCPNTDVGVPIRAKSFQDDFERVRSRRHARESQLPPLVGLRRQLPANERWRADSDGGTRNDAAGRVRDGSNEGSRQSLSDGDRWNQEAGDREARREQPENVHASGAVRHWRLPVSEAATGHENLHGATWKGWRLNARGPDATTEGDRDGVYCEIERSAGVFTFPARFPASQIVGSAQ